MFIVDKYGPLWPCLLPISTFSTVHGSCVLFFLTADNTSGARVQEHYLKWSGSVRSMKEEHIVRIKLDNNNTVYLLHAISPKARST